MTPKRTIIFQYSVKMCCSLETGTRENPRTEFPVIIWLLEKMTCLCFPVINRNKEIAQGISCQSRELYHVRQKMSHEDAENVKHIPDDDFHLCRKQKRNAST